MCRLFKEMAEHLHAVFVVFHAAGLAYAVHAEDGIAHVDTFHG